MSNIKIHSLVNYANEVENKQKKDLQEQCDSMSSTPENRESQTKIVSPAVMASYFRLVYTTKLINLSRPL